MFSIKEYNSTVLLFRLRSYESFSSKQEFSAKGVTFAKPLLTMKSQVMGLTLRRRDDILIQI